MARQDVVSSWQYLHRNLHLSVISSSSEEFSVFLFSSLLISVSVEFDRYERISAKVTLLTGVFVVLATLLVFLDTFFVFLPWSILCAWYRCLLMIDLSFSRTFWHLWHSNNFFSTTKSLGSCRFLLLCSLQRCSVIILQEVFLWSQYWHWNVHPLETCSSEEPSSLLEASIVNSSFGSSGSLFFSFLMGRFKFGELRSASYSFLPKPCLSWTCSLN